MEKGVNRGLASLGHSEIMVDLVLQFVDVTVCMSLGKVRRFEPEQSHSGNCNMLVGGG